MGEVYGLERDREGQGVSESRKEKGREAKREKGGDRERERESETERRRKGMKAK